MESNNKFFNDFWPYFGGYFKNELDTSKEVDFVLSHLENKSMTILDLFCGYGRHSYQLAMRGYSILGIDKCNSYFLELQKINKMFPNFEFKIDDFLTLNIKSSYDCVLLLFGSFGYYGKSNDLNVLKMIFSVLNDGGIFIFDTRSFEQVKTSFVGINELIHGGIKITQSGSLNSITKEIKVKWVATIDNIKTDTYTTIITLYSLNEMKAMLSSVGFKELYLYDDYTKESLCLEPKKRCIWICKK